MPIEVTMPQPEARVVSTKLYANISSVGNQNCVLVRWIWIYFFVSSWNSILQNFLNARLLTEGAHAHHIKLVTMEMKRMRQ